MKNIIILFLFPIFRKFFKKAEPFNKKKPKILIVSTTALGDTLWATPSIRAIKKKYPKSFLACLVSPVGKKVLQNNPYIDKIICTKNPLFDFFFIKLKKYRFQKILIFHTSRRLILPLCHLLNVPIIGSEKINKGLDDLLDEKIKKTFCHEIERRFQILEKIDIKNPSPKMDFFLKKNPSFEKSFPKKTPVIVLHPGAADPFKRWHIGSFKILATLFLKKNTTIFITGGKKEKHLLNHFKNLPVSLFYNQSLNNLSLLLKKADLFITNDTGPLHLACALNIQTIALFIPTDPKHCGPYKTSNIITLQKKIPCKKCLKRKCKNPVCFSQITPHEVFHLSKNFLKKNKFFSKEKK